MRLNKKYALWFIIMQLKLIFLILTYLIIDHYEMKVKIMRYKVKNYCIKYHKTKSTLLEKVEIIQLKSQN